MPPKNVAQIAIQANPSALPSGLRQATSMLHLWAGNAQSLLNKVGLAPKVNDKKWWVQQAVGTAVGTQASRGIDMLIEQGRKVFDFNEQMTRFGIVAGIGGKQLDAVGGRIRKIAEETGVNSAALLEGTRRYVDLAGAANFTVPKISLLARASQASEAEIGQLAQVMYQLQRSMKISDTDLEDALGGIIAAGKEGAVSFKDMAGEISELAPQAARYGLVGRDGIVKMTAMMQVARSGFGSVSEMGTGITRVFSGLTMHADKFAEYGVQIFETNPKTGMKTWRHFSKIFNDIIKHNVLGRNPFLMRKAFGRSEADRTMRMWMEGTEQMEMFEKAGRAAGVVQKDLNTYLESSSGKLATAMERMKNAIAEAFTPERITAFVKGVEDLADKLGPVVNAVGKVGDTLGWFYDKGKAIRGVLSGDGESSRGGRMGELQRIKEARVLEEVRGMSRPEAMAWVEKDWASGRSWRDKMRALMPDDQTTEASDRMAVEALMDADPGTDVRNSALSYLSESKMTKERRKKLAEEIAKRRTLTEYYAGRGRSRASGVSRDPWMALADASGMDWTAMARIRPEIGSGMASTQTGQSLNWARELIRQELVPGLIFAMMEGRHRIFPGAPGPYSPNLPGAGGFPNLGGMAPNQYQSYRRSP